ncbi:MAG: phage holin family protein [Bacteroidota bacterium]
MLEKIKEYVSSRILLLKIEGTQRVSDAFSVLFRKIVLLLIFCFFLIFISVALALWIGEIYDSNIIGFLVTGAIYLLVFIVFLIFKKQLLEKYIKDEVVRTIFKNLSK